MMRRTWLILILAPCMAIAHSADVTAGEIVLENRFVRRVLAEGGGVWRTERFSRTDGMDSMPVQSDEFLIRLPDGAELTVGDYLAADKPVVRTNGTARRVAVRYVPRGEPVNGAPTEVEVEYYLADEPYLRKHIRLILPQDAGVDRLEVERFRTKKPCDRGGRGEPIFIGTSWFVGLEYPGSETKHEKGLVTLAHFPDHAKPDRQTGRNVIQSRTAVAGVGAKGDPIELAFADYLETIRRPSRIMLHYNSWYDFRENELTFDAMVTTFEAFKTNVLDPYGLTMNVFVPDDGWQNPQSIWVPRSNLYPDGFQPLREALEARGTRLGLWIPFNGFNLDVTWGARQGYEKSNEGRYYCLTGPRYNKAIREASERIIRQGNIGYYKHDFNQLRCSAEGHGHLPDDRHGHEANLDAELELLAFERQLQPDIYLNVTSYVWHSPWWLVHADSIWMAASDFGYNKAWPQLSPREWAMSYRDTHFHKLYRERGVLVPLSAMMTHGIIHGRYQRLGGEEETLREWSDYVVMYYGRGVQLMEWYVTPEMMTPKRWDILGRATRWAIENCDILENVVMVGGDPRNGEAYGYAHWLDDRGILVLRNPDVRSRGIRVPFDKSVRYRGENGRPFHGRIIYPFVENVPTQFTSGRPVRLEIPGGSVIVCKLTAGTARSSTPAMPPAASGAIAELVRSEAGGNEIRARVPVPDEDMQRCELFLIARSRLAGTTPGLPEVNGKVVEPRSARARDWTIRSVDLRPHRGRTADVALVLDEGNQPFSRPDSIVSAWLLMDRRVASPPTPSDHLPLAISQGHRRQTVELLPDTELKGVRNRRRLTEAQLENIQDAKLRIFVFDVNGEPRYRDKFIFLNGRKIAIVPPNVGPRSAWQESVIDLTPDAIKRLRLGNTLEIDNPVGDYFKCTGLALAVRMPDGTWVETRPHDAVHSSVADWAYAEGTPFTNNRSGVIELRFDHDEP